MVKNKTNLQLTEVDYDPFAGPELLRLAPTTEPQLEIWTACLLGGDDANRAFNESVSLRLRGKLIRAALEQALQALIQRHEALRSAFSADGKQICMFRELPLEFSYLDISAKEISEKKYLIEDYVRQDAQYVFDLLQGPLFKAGLLKTAADEHELVLTAHHVVCDGWSIGIMMQDLAKLYSAYAQNTVPDLPEAPSFGQFAEEQRLFSDSEEYRKIETFWLNQYQDKVPVLNLLTDFPRPAFRTFKSTRFDFPLDRELVAALKKAGTQVGCSFVTTLTAAFEILLHQLTRQNEIVLGLPAAGQSVTGNYGLVGHCVNLLPLRSTHNPDISFLDYLRTRKAELFDAYDHQQITFGSLLKKLAIARDPSRVPLVPVVFNIDMGLDNGVAFYGLQHQLISNPRAYENFELALNATGQEQTLCLEWSFNVGLFKAETIAGIHTKFETLLQNFIATPNVALREILRPDSDEINPFIAEWNSTQAVYPKDKSLHDLITESARKFPDKIAVRSGSEKLTYRELDEKANQLARILLENSVRPGDTVGLALDRSLEMIIGLLAIMKSGAAYVPIDTLHPAERIEYQLQDAACKLLLINQKYTKRFGESVRELFIENIAQRLHEYAPEAPEVPVSGSDLAYILYTSGTTGRPKGVQIEHHSVVNVLLSIQKNPGLTADDKTLSLATIAFDLSTVEIYLPLVTGAELILVDSITGRDGYLLAGLIQSEGISFMQATPATWRMLWESGWRGSKSLRVISCAEALSKDLAHKLLDSCHSLWNLYGPTETTIYATGKEIFKDDELITIGRPVANTQIFILNKQLKSVPIGEAGELCIAGEGLARGYLNQPELTAGKFVTNPFSDLAGAKMYRTGDLAKFLPNGEIQYLGRIDQQVKIRGHRIELAEIEHQLLKQAGINDAVVIAREDVPGDQRLVAYLVADSEGEQYDNQLKTWKDGIKKMLPDFMVPNHFVVLQKLPVTANGKIDKKALPKPVQEFNIGSKNGLDLTNTEKVLIQIWKELLNINQLTAQDDFFELGGHSLLAVQVMTRIEKETGTRLPISTLFESNTIEKLAQAIEEKDKIHARWNSLVAIKPGGSKVPLYLIHGSGLNVLNFYGLAFNLDPDQPVYGLQAKGINGIDQSEDMIEAIAAHYISQIMLQNPKGPYALAGYSFGGIVAYEMAKQLEAKGRKVTLLAMFDTYAYTSNFDDSFSTKLAKKVRLQLPKIHFIINSFRKNPRTTLNYQWMITKEKFTNLLVRLGFAKHNTGGEAHSHSDDIYQKLFLAYEQYKLTPYEGTVCLFRAKERKYFVPDPVYLGWKRYAKKGVEIYDVPGDHKTMLLQPNDQEFALILQRALDNS
ncbi:MAG: amino acid adenylation domain-containing protein [Cytophagaceae bacterium]|nr:amino acid adenylation domain-containing protein [Cytophagaceae bacterium]